MTNDRARKQQIRERMAATGEPYSVAARHLDSSETLPWQAFFQGFFNRSAISEKPNENQALKFWMVPYYQLVTSSWEGDTALLELLGSSYRYLEARGNYFCFNNYLTHSVNYWFEMEGDELVDNTEAVPNIPTIQAALRKDYEMSKDVQTHSYEGVTLLQIKLWPLMSQHKKERFVKTLIQRIQSLPSFEEANTPDIKYNQYVAMPPVKRQNLSVDDRVKFFDDRFWWNVKAVSESFVILTRDTAFNKSWVYTIIEWEAGARGAHNSYGYSTETDEEIQKLLLALEATKAKDSNFNPLHKVTLGRNQTALHISKIESSSN